MHDCAGKAFNHAFTSTFLALIRHNKKDGGMLILKTLFLKFKWAAKTFNTY